MSTIPTEPSAEPTCDKCGITITSGLMAAMCPYRERCAFWPEDKDSQDFLDSLNMRYVPGKGFPGDAARAALSGKKD